MPITAIQTRCWQWKWTIHWLHKELMVIAIHAINDLFGYAYNDMNAKVILLKLWSYVPVKIGNSHHGAPKPQGMVLKAPGLLRWIQCKFTVKMHEQGCMWIPLIYMQFPSIHQKCRESTALKSWHQLIPTFSHSQNMIHKLQIMTHKNTVLTVLTFTNSLWLNLWMDNRCINA